MLLALLLFMSACFALPEPGSPPTAISLVQTPTPNATQIAGRDFATKEAFQQIVKQTVEAARAKPPTPAPDVFAPVPDSTPAGSGAIASIIPPFYVHDFGFENTWYKDIEGGNVRIYVHAGYVFGPGGEITQQGLVVVQVLKMSQKDNQRSIDTVYYKKFLTPTESGPIRITGAAGERLILQSTKGTRFYFDVPSHQFVPSLTWVSPISTPSPQPARP